MIHATTAMDSKTRLLDQSADISKEEMSCIQAAMDNGLTEFTVPTPGADDGSRAWKVETWVALRDGKPVSFLVAHDIRKPHFKLIGPEMDLTTKKAKPPNGLRELQKRA